MLRSKLFLRYYSSGRRTLKDVITKREIDKEVTVRGWVKTTRSMKEHIFADM
jgi:aspartyl/asparaginyl-tRNA synthetase